jgi:DNA invertase Pin-like site-specific DNA recombinase
MFQEAVSGASDIDQRPKLTEALTLLAQHSEPKPKGQVEPPEDVRLVVVKRDRLARSVYVASAIDRATGDRVWSMDSAFTSGPEDQLMKNILNAFAEFERAKIAWRTGIGKRVNRAKGLWPGGNTPFGLEVDAEGALYCTGVDVAETVRRIFQLKNDGENLSAIAQYLEVNGYKARRGGPMTYKQVGRIIGARIWYQRAGVLP